ncbi:cytochrome P450 [Sodiomyces alkalinus F11]|uniref:Cytochrome P450 n=1 Tax=Sodiomyces alkalinus (strain CBS 110278 / VKM F-3762 / F11) TaxID=1314773 RepID=A0A3N2PXS6_SODAK|nr:cytochrome P450 [Sodiomyces alkalinus F11]ROT39268.1 cytochrome P450 [Sodiomyces alkalinus F11]
MNLLLTSLLPWPKSGGWLVQVPVYTAGLLLVAIFLNVLRQCLPRPKTEPPLVFHWIPFVGNAVSYGMDPFRFYVRRREKHGDIFTFILFGRKMTVYLGIGGNEFILNGKLKDVNAEEIYSPLTTPVFGSDVVYDCPNAKLMEQKKFIKFGLTQAALASHVQLIEEEVLGYIASAPAFGQQGEEARSGTVDITAAMAQITLFTAARALQGAEVRAKLTTEFADLYHDLDGGFRPINFVMPWAPLPQNRRRDAAHAKMRAVYTDIIRRRRANGMREEGEEPDMIWNLMRCTYKDGRPVPDKEIAHMMITLLMAGQHSSASSSAWIMLRLASRPDIAEEVYREQAMNLGGRHDGNKEEIPQLRYEDIDKLPLLQNVVRETLRVNSSIHTIMRKVKNPMPVPGTDYVVTPDKVLVAAPIVTHMDAGYFPDAETWDPHRWDAKPGGDEEGGEEEEGEDAAEDLVDYGYGITSKGTKSPYLPFGAGRHRCIGEKFAYVNLCTIVATLVRNFRFGTLDGKSWVPPTDYSSLFSRPNQPAVIRWERRFPKVVG